MSLRVAEKMSAYAKQLVEESYGNRPFSIAICDKSGFLVLFHKQDDVKLLTIQLSINKAYTAARMGVSTAEFLRRLQRENLNIAYFADEQFVAMPGGVPIFDENNQLIGAVGIGGLKEDGEIAQKVAAAVGA